MNTAAGVRNMGGFEIAGSILAGLTTISGALYLILRRLKGDGRVDALDDKSHKLIETLTCQLEKERERANGYHDAIERIAKERNDAVQHVGRLEGLVESLQTQVTYLRDEIAQLEAENSKLVMGFANMQLQMTQMAENLAKISNGIVP